ncbi:MAG: hypothetical protein ACRDQU_17010 [Pseudonocardiaceae bacterium]
MSIRDDTRITLRLDFQRTNHHPETVELVQRAAPLRFVRLDRATDRPEVATLLAELDRLRVPFTTGRPAAAKALRANQIRFTDSDLETAIKTRKNCAEGVRAGAPGDDQTEIDYGCADTDAPDAVSAAQRCAAQVARSARSELGSDSAGAARDLPASRSAQVSRSTSQDCATESPQDRQICPRCNYPAARLVPPDGLCPGCAYPAGGAPDHNTQEED